MVEPTPVDFQNLGDSTRKLLGRRVTHACHCVCVFRFHPDINFFLSKNWVVLLRGIKFSCPKIGSSFMEL